MRDTKRYGVAAVLFINQSQLLWALTAKVSPKSQSPYLKAFSILLVPYVPFRVSTLIYLPLLLIRFLFFSKKGAMLQFGFLAAVFWWALIAFNMSFEVPIIS